MPTSIRRSIIRAGARRRRDGSLVVCLTISNRSRRSCSTATASTWPASTRVWIFGGITSGLTGSDKSPQSCCLHPVPCAFCLAGMGSAHQQPRGRSARRGSRRNRALDSSISSDHPEHHAPPPDNRLESCNPFPQNARAVCVLLGILALHYLFAGTRFQLADHR